ncbi:MAG: aspartate carbamoyltransferase catalytic subunit [Armatimonadetes bacterium]|nr:aspartate carbamoyltransferase catalytic subunit [Armatimonadota bacterium]
MNNVLSIRQTPVDVVQTLLTAAGEFKRSVKKSGPVKGLPRRTVGLLFFENSTRTRVGFEQACHYLGYRTVNFSGSGSSVKKGETLKDTILTLRYERLEAVVIRHSASGSCNLAARYFNGPVINAGDGWHEHPTQALGDGLTVIERKGKIDGLKIAIVGDITHSRVARSNAWLFSKMGAEVRFVGPRTLVPGQTSQFPATVYHDLRAGLDGVDVVMALRLQLERMEEGLVSIGEYRRLYQINRSSLRSAAPDAIVMHPGPMNRGVEIDDLTADGPNSVITEQVTNCIFGRMASLAYAFGDVRAAGTGGLT